MFRFEHMPSDFNPMYLFLGDASDLAALASVLRRFSGHPTQMPLANELPGSLSRSSLVLLPAEHELGMRLVEDGFEWRLNAWQAGQIADRIDALAATKVKSGSDIFEVGSEGEIPVKVSRGEFTDDFLVTRT